jgi:hypothetical protein
MNAARVREVQVTFDCADPRALSLFWNAALGYELPPPPPGFDSWDAFSATLPAELQNSASASQDPTGAGPRLFFQRVPEGKAAKNRVHLDVRAAPGLTGDERYAALDRECERVLGLGATVLERLEPDGFNELCIVMQDPEGNEFCLD